MAADPAHRRATYQDVLDAPEHLDAESYRLVVVHGEEGVARIEPFAAIELELAALWPSG